MGQRAHCQHHMDCGFRRSDDAEARTVIAAQAAIQ